MSIKLFDLTGKVALVTGGASGLGKAIAFGLGRAGATIVINGQSSMKKIDSAVNEFKNENCDKLKNLLQKF